MAGVYYRMTIFLINTKTDIVVQLKVGSFKALPELKDGANPKDIADFIGRTDELAEYITNEEWRFMTNDEIREELIDERNLDAKLESGEFEDEREN